MVKVLVVDDDPQMRRLVTRILSARHEVTEASNGVEGLTRFRTLRPALVVTDILMPEKEGIETIRDIRREDATVRILAISGSGGTGHKMYLEFAKQLGADAVLAKPFRAEELAATVEKLLEP